MSKNLNHVSGGGTYMITDDCFNCGACMDACPTGAITKGQDHYEIDKPSCFDCGQCENVCPNGSIKPQ